MMYCSMTRVYWSAVDARLRTVYRCRILAADDSAASKNLHAFKINKNCEEPSTNGVNSVTSSASSATVAVTAVRSLFSILACDEFGGRKMDQCRSIKSDEVADDSSTTPCRSELSSAKAVNTPSSTEGKPYRQTASGDYSTSRGTDNTVASDDFSAHDALSRGTDGGIGTCTGHCKSTGDHSSCADAVETINSNRRLFQSSVPAFDNAADKTDTNRNAVTERNICTAGLRSDFDTHTQLKCMPLKLIGQLDGAVPDSESDASDEDADIPVSCYDVLSRSLVTPTYHPFAVDHSMVCSPFKCVKCKRVYRTKESCALHSAVCTFEVSSSSESDKSECDGDWALDASDQDTESCYSDDADDGVISEYLNSSRNSENAANCSSLGCQTENILMATEDCDVNANCKMLCNSNAKSDHSRLRTAGSGFISGGIENIVTDPCTKILHCSPNTIDEAVVMCNASCVVENKDVSSDSVFHSVMDFAVQVTGTVGNEPPSIAETLSNRQLPELSSLEHELLSCCSRARDLIDSETSRRLSVHGCESAQRSSADVLSSQLCANSRVDVPLTSHKALLHASDYCFDSDHNDSKAAEKNTASTRELMGLSRAEFNAVSSIGLAGERMSPLVDSNKTCSGAVVSIGYDSVEQLSSCVGTCFHASSSSNVDVPCHVTRSSSASASAQRCAMKLQDVLTSSATMVWPSATVYLSAVNNHSVSSVTRTSGIYTQLLEPRGTLPAALTTASIVVPSALPNAVAAACIQPVNIARPVYAIGHVPVPSSSPGHPVRAMQQFLRPVLVAPMAWLTPQLAVMNAVRLRQQLSHHSAVTSPCSSLYATSQQSFSSVHATSVSASPQLVQSHCQASVPQLSHFGPQKTFNKAGFATPVAAACPQSFSFRLPLVAATSPPRDYMQSVMRADPSSHQSVSQLVSSAAVSRPISAPLTVAAVPSLHSSLSSTNSVLINQLPVGHNPSSLLAEHVAAPSALSKYVVSSGGMLFSWLTGTTPVTVNSVCGSTSGPVSYTHLTLPTILRV